MQSKHTFGVSHLFVKKGSRRVHNGSLLGPVLDQHVTFGVKKGVPKNGSKNVYPPEPNDGLFTDREAPGGAASRARCSDKKQLFEQQLRHCSKFLQKKVVWAQHRCKKADRIAESLQKKLKGLLKKCCLLKATANVETESIETMLKF